MVEWVVPCSSVADGVDLLSKTLLPAAAGVLRRRRCIKQREFENWSMGLDEVEPTPWMATWKNAMDGVGVKHFCV